VIQQHTTGKERVTRPLLTSLLAKTHGIDLNMGLLTKESNMRRNKLILEDVVRAREKQLWLD